jgi:hypothetical protein
MAARKKARKNSAKRLDNVLGKRPRGRPGVRPSEIRGRADHYRLIFGEIWDSAISAGPRKTDTSVGEQIVHAESDEDVINALNGAPQYNEEFQAITGLILKVKREKKFPKTRLAQINFLADSLAGRGRISARRSRDICEKARAQPTHHIIRQDFYIECTCGYEGPARHGACAKCGAVCLPLTMIPFLS